MLIRTMAPLGDEAGRVSALDRYMVLDTPPDARFDRITTLVRRVLDVPMAAVSLIDRERQWLKAWDGDLVQEIARDISFCTHTIRTRAPLMIEDATKDPRFANNPLVTKPPHIRAYAGVPLSTPDGFNIGALCAIDLVPHAFSPAQIEILENFAALVMDEMELRLIAETDFLTGALTRRAFVNELDKAQACYERTLQPASLITLDIDRFKSINDTRGHAAGDVVLKALVNVCGDELRATDMLGRLGGEEFGVLLCRTDFPEAMKIAERLRNKVARMAVPGHETLMVTASFGIAEIGPAAGALPTAAVADWMARSDHALYAAKQGGRNRCCAAHTSVHAADLSDVVL